MKKLFTIVAAAFVGAGLWAQSATYEFSSHGHDKELTVKAKPWTGESAAGRTITLRPQQRGTAMQAGFSLKSATGPLKAPDDITLIGFVSDGKEVNPAMGAMYKVPYRASQSFERIGMTNVMNAWGGVEAAGTYYTVYQFQISATSGYNYLYKYNTTTWTTTGYKMLEDFSLFSSAQACDPTDNQVYGSYMKADGSGYEFGIADFESGTHTTICGLEKPWSVCAIDNAGNAYAIDMDGDLYTVDKTTGDMELIAPTGVSSQYLGGGVYDNKGGRILWSVCNDLNSGLYSVNPTTGETALVTEFADNEEVIGMFIGAPIAVDDAPEQPADLTLDFPEGSLSGTVSFTVPATTFGGAEGTGEVKWSLTMNNLPMGNGTAAYGERIDAPVKAFSNGNTTFIVTLSNDAGNSPQAKATIFVGKGAPAIPLVKLEYDEATETASLSWDPITKAVDGGYLNPDDITYTVTRYPDAKTVAEHTAECAVTDHLPIPKSITTYTYTVVAENGDVVSGTGNTVPLRLGTYATPYVEDFTQMGNMADFTILDENNDGTTWTYGMGGATVYGMQNLAMDDWLITPGVNLKGGRKYYVELTFRTLQMQPPYAEVEVKTGNSATIGGMTNTLIAPTDISELSKAPFSTIIEAEADGKYYIGVHAITEESNWVQVQKIVIKDATMPGPATDLVITPGPDDALDAIVEFKAPATDAAGDPLTSIDRIEVVRGGMLVKTFTKETDNFKPGDALSFEDAVWSPGNYQWVITAYNEDGAGLEASAIEYVGLAVPAMPQNVKAVEEGNTGRVTLSWDPVTTGTHGRPMSPQFIQYRILNRGQYIDNNPDVSGNTYTAQIAAEGEQTFAQMGVQVYNYLGSNVGFSQVMPVGKPYTEYKESFAGGQAVHDIAITDTYLYSLWQIHADAAMTGPGSADADGGYAMMFCEYVDGTSTLQLGKFDLSACKDPELGISIYNLGDDTDHNRNILEVLVDKGNGFESAGTLTAGDDDPLNTWVRRRLDLSDYAQAGNIVIALRGTIVNFQYLPVDKITIGSTYDHNLSATNFATPAKVNSGNRFGVSLSVENNGRKTAENFSVSLLQNGTEVSRKEVESLAADAAEDVIFTCNLSTLAGNEVEFSAVINYDADENKADNTTEAHTVEVKQPIYPAPGTLTAEVSDGKVNLAWSEPSKDVPAQEHTESFEEGEGMVHDLYEDWTFIDGDGAQTYYYGNFYAGCSDPKAYIVFDPGQNGDTAAEFAPHTGERYLAAVCPSTGVANDDWAISPQLSGDAQKVTFFARSLWIYDGNEAFEFLYSADGLAPEDFTSVATVTDVPAEWTEYSYDVPAGAMYFAIRCVSNNQYMFMVDDVTFVPAGASTANLEHQGYHVYRDETRISTDVVTECAHTDAPAEDGDYTYTVTAMYNLGESVPTNRVLVTVAHDGIGDATVSAVTVTAGIGTITVTGAEGLNVTVNDMAGKTVATSKGNLRARVAAGCYLVTAGTRATKVMVK